MEKKLSISDIILLSIAGIFDFFTEIKDPGGLISNYYQNFYGFVPKRWKKVNIYKALSHHKKQKRIIKINRKLFLTAEGESYIKNRFPSIFYQTKYWDGYLYFILFDVLELKRRIRDRLRKLLKQLNFAQLQKSVWCSFNNKLIDWILNFKKFYQLKNEVLIIKGKLNDDINFKNLLYSLWQIEKINQEYKKIFNQYQNIFIQYQKNKNIENLLNQFRKITKEFFQITTKDPFLPQQLLPPNWYYFKSLKMKKKIAKIIKIKKQNV